MPFDSDLTVITHLLKYTKENPNHDARGRFAPANGVKASADWQEKYTAREGVGLAQNAAKHAMSVEDYTKASDAHTQQLVQSAAPWTRMHEASFVSMLGDGRFKSQFEIKNSSGLVSEQQRAKAEANLFGLDPHTPAFARPIYGYMSEHGDGVVSRDTFQKQYGSVAVHLHDDVLEHTTVTGGDSLNATFGGMNPTMLPTLARNADHHIFDSMNDPLRFSKASDVYPYLEAQYHDGLAASSIKEVVFHAQPQEATLTLLKEKKIPYRVAIQPLPAPPAKRGKKAATTLTCLAMLQDAPGWFLIHDEPGAVRIVDTLRRHIYPSMSLASVVARDAWEPAQSTYIVHAPFTKDDADA